MVSFRLHQKYDQGKYQEITSFGFLYIVIRTVSLKSEITSSLLTMQTFFTNTIFHWNKSCVFSVNIKSTQHKSDFFILISLAHQQDLDARYYLLVLELLSVFKIFPWFLCVNQFPILHLLMTRFYTRCFGLEIIHKYRR